MKNYLAIGLMSGTSLDGVDITLCEFIFQNGKWTFKILEAETRSYSKSWIHKLKTAPELDGMALAQLDAEYGHFLGLQTKQFMASHSCEPEFIASHGHTVFHQPHKGFTLQIGNGSAIAAETEKMVINDFRTLDVALGGQGAPLVPIGDRLLFGEYGYCLNLGGFANISFEHQEQRIAFDICPANIVLNYYVANLGLEYDDKGKIASSGKVNLPLLHELNQMAFYQKSFPKSLGREWLEHEFIPIIDKTKLSIPDILSTLTQHITTQISRTVGEKPDEKILITGGGAANNFLIQSLRTKVKQELVVPDKSLVDYKEALVFAFLGLLRLSNQDNCLASVTGAKRNCSGGSIHQA